MQSASTAGEADDVESGQGGVLPGQASAMTVSELMSVIVVRLFHLQRGVKAMSSSVELGMSGRQEPAPEAKLKSLAMAVWVEAWSPHCRSVIGIQPHENYL